MPQSDPHTMLVEAIQLISILKRREMQQDKEIAELKQQLVDNDIIFQKGNEVIDRTKETLKAVKKDLELVDKLKKENKQWIILVVVLTICLFSSIP